MSELGLDPGAIVLREIRDEAEAEAAGFPGSPTILVDGRDISPSGPERPRGLTCRVFERRDGRVSPLPDPQDVREALARAAS